MSPSGQVEEKETGFENEWMNEWLTELLLVSRAYCPEWWMSSSSRRRSSRRGWCRCCASLGNLCSSFCDIAPPLIPESNSVLSPNKIPTGPRRKRDRCDVMKISLPPCSCAFCNTYYFSCDKECEWTTVVLLDVPVIARLIFDIFMCCSARRGSWVIIPRDVKNTPVNGDIVVWLGEMF